MTYVYPQYEEEGATSDTEEFISDLDPSMLHFMINAGEDVTTKQLRDDLITLLIAGHETVAAVLTWTTYLLAYNPEHIPRIREEVGWYTTLVLLDLLGAFFGWLGGLPGLKF